MKVMGDRGGADVRWGGRLGIEYDETKGWEKSEEVTLG